MKCLNFPPITFYLKVSRHRFSALLKPLSSVVFIKFSDVSLSASPLLSMSKTLVLNNSSSYATITKIKKKVG